MSLADRRRPPMRPVDLPGEVRTVLALIAADMRDVPRDCLTDPAELFVWLRRMAARIEGVERIRTQAPPSRSGLTPRPQISPVGGVAGFAGYGSSTQGLKTAPTGRKSSLCTIAARKGHPIPVEIRRKPWL